MDYANKAGTPMVDPDEELAQASPMPLGLAREIARQGEARLTAITSLATAADLRATTLCGIFGAASVAVTAAVLASISANRPINLILAGAVVSLGLFGAALIAAHAGAPRDFFVGGGNPDILREWSWDGYKWRSEVEMLDATACRYAASIGANRKLLELSSRRVIAALCVAGSSLPIALIAFFVNTVV
jgi:hypothetical protein